MLDRTVVYYNFIILEGFNSKEFLLKVSSSISSLQLFRSINLHKTLICTTLQQVLIIDKIVKIKLKKINI